MKRPILFKWQWIILLLLAVAQFGIIIFLHVATSRMDEQSLKTWLKTWEINGVANEMKGMWGGVYADEFVRVLFRGGILFVIFFVFNRIYFMIKSRKRKTIHE